MVEWKNQIHNASSVSSSYTNHVGLLPLPLFRCILCGTKSGDEYRCSAWNVCNRKREVVSSGECERFHWRWIQGLVRRQGIEGGNGSCCLSLTPVGDEGRVVRSKEQVLRHLIAETRTGRLESVRVNRKLKFEDLIAHQIQSFPLLMSRTSQRRSSFNKTS